jgi:branched-chain amino acid transport system ATP-binding protein
VPDGPLAQAESLTLGYDGAAAVRELNLRVDAGEVLALLGPNGAGKSTTLSAFAGFVKPISGSIRYAGESIANASPHALARRAIAHVPEGRGVFQSLTVAEHLRLCGRQANVTEAMAYFPKLAELEDRRAGLLSGGEQQMLALACALARRPRLLLIDELSLGLAPIVVEGLLPIVRDFADRSGCAVILVEQHVQLALEIADRAMVLAHGEVVLQDSAAALRESRELLASSYLGETVLEAAG